MNKEACTSVYVYQLYMVLSEPLFWGPILIYSLVNLGKMSLPDIFFMEAVVTLVLVAASIPAGALADTIGKKNAALIGRTFLLASICLFATMVSPLGAWLGNLSWALGFSLTSATESALLYETLYQSGNEKNFRQVQGRAVGLRFLVVAFTCLCVGFLASIHPRLPLWLSIPGQAVALLLVFLFKDVSTTTRYSVANQISLMRDGLRFVWSIKAVLWLVAFAALIGVISKVWFFLYNPYFELVGVPLSQYGIIFFVLNIVAGVSSHYADSVEKWMGELVLVIGSILFIGIPIILMALFPVYLMAFAVIAQNIVRGFIRPFTEDFLHHHVTSGDMGHARSTMLSVKNAVVQLVSVLGLWVAGEVLGVWSLTTSLLFLGIFSLTAGAVTVYSYLKLASVR